MVPTVTLPTSAAAATPAATSGAGATAAAASATAGSAGALAIAATPATTAASQDFLLTLGQLLGTTAPTPAAAATTTTQAASAVLTTDAEKDVMELLDSAALEAMLPFSLATPMMIPQADGSSPATTAVAGNSAGIGALTSGGASGSDRALLGSLLAGMAEIQETEQGEAAMFANLNGSTALPVDEATQARAATSSDPGRGLHTPVGSSEWADELGTRLTWMAERGHQTASLRLSPEHLGPLEIRISIRDDQASVWFGAAHADTRAAIEQALPRLRELFVAQGLTLADAGVSHEAPRDQSRQHASDVHGEAAAGGGEAESSVISIAHQRLGLVDAYA